jgi:ParB family chromosome partitioning protein
MLRVGELSAGHGKALLRIKDPKLQGTLARKAAQLGLSVRTIEALAAKYERSAAEKGGEEEEVPEEERQLERLAGRVGSFLGLERVVLRLDSQWRKRLSLLFETEASWKRFVSRIRE